MAMTEPTFGVETAVTEFKKEATPPTKTLEAIRSDIKRTLADLDNHIRRVEEITARFRSAREQISKDIG